MAQVMVTGGTGRLGRLLVPKLVAAGQSVRILTRQADPGYPPLVHVYRGDLATGDIDESVFHGVSVLVHAASDSTTADATDIEGMKRLIAGCHDHWSPHFIYVSIVGVDRLRDVSYYRAKYEAEQLLMASDLWWTVFRTTQWHQLLLEWLRLPEDARSRVLASGMRFQPIDADEVADRIVQLTRANPGRKSPDFGGPEVLSAERLAEIYADVTGEPTPTIGEPASSRLAAAFRGTDHLTPERPFGHVTWREFLEREVRRAEAAAGKSEAP